jgi:hypothetical protein
MTNDDGRKPEGGPERYPKAGAGARSGVDGNGPKRFSVQRKMAVVARLLRGEPLELVAREANVSIASVRSMPAGQSSKSNARCTPRRSRLCGPTAGSSSGRGAPMNRSKASRGATLESDKRSAPRSYPTTPVLRPRAELQEQKGNLFLCRMSASPSCWLRPRIPPALAQRTECTPLLCTAGHLVADGRRRIIVSVVSLTDPPQRPNCRWFCLLLQD